MSQLPGGRFLGSNKESQGPGVLTTLLRVYIEERDRGALETFFELLYDEHFTDLAIQVHSYGPASEVTVKEVIDDSLAKLLADVMEERYRKAPDSAAEHLKYMLRRRFIDRRRYWDRGHEELVDRHAAIVDRGVRTPAMEAQLRESEALLDARLEDALRSMSERDARMIRLRLEGKPHAEIARELGMDEVSIRKAYTRAVDQLMSKLVTHSPTMVLRLQQLRAEKTTRPTRPGEETWPTLDEIRAALIGITERVRDAVDRLHLQGVDRESLAAELGPDTLDVLLRRGYDLLEARFKVSFPEAFDHAKG